jgi:hypothetical protein
MVNDENALYPARRAGGSHMSIEGTGSSERGPEQQVARKPKVKVSVPKKPTGRSFVRFGPGTQVSKPSETVPEKQKKSLIRPGAKGREADRLARSLRVTPEEMPTEAAQLKIMLLPSKNWRSSYTREQQRRRPHGPDKPAPEGSS